MGLLDFLFGGGEGGVVQELSFAELEDWLLSRRGEEASGVVREAAPAIDEVKELVKQIRILVKRLDSLEMPQNMFERAEKIIKTSKPDYVKSMLDALDGLDFKRADSIDDVAGFASRLEAAVNNMGRIDATKGRYLSFGFEEEQKGIQRKGKKLLEKQKQLSLILASSERLGKINLLVEENSKLKQLEAQKDALAKEKMVLGGRLKDCVRERKELDSKLLAESGKREYSRLDDINKGLAEANAQKVMVEDAVFQAIGPIKKDLMKYRRGLFEAPGDDRGRLLDALVKNPVDAFLASDVGKVEQLLSGFRKAVESGVVTVKDNVKVLTKAGNAIKKLDSGRKERHRCLTDEIRILEAEAAAISGIDNRGRLQVEAKGVGEKIRGLEEKIREINARLGESEAMIERQRKLLTSRMDEFTEGGVAVK